MMMISLLSARRSVSLGRHIVNTKSNICNLQIVSRCGKRSGNVGLELRMNNNNNNNVNGYRSVYGLSKGRLLSTSSNGKSSNSSSSERPMSLKTFLYVSVGLAVAFGGIKYFFQKDINRIRFKIQGGSEGITRSKEEHEMLRREQSGEEIIVKAGFAMVAGLALGVGLGLFLHKSRRGITKKNHRAVDVALKSFCEKFDVSIPQEKITNVGGNFGKNGAIFHFNCDVKEKSYTVEAQAIRNTKLDKWNCTYLKVLDGFGTPVKRLT